ncbi:MAG TPA: hypothetical protein VM260_26690 [Pirellula sp.]|nr:hypothetical protein [Pirellula sp.]
MGEEVPNPIQNLLDPINISADNASFDRLCSCYCFIPPGPFHIQVKKDHRLDRKTLLETVRRGPVHVGMNDGSSYVIPPIEFCLISDMAAYGLIKDQEDGKLRGKHRALVCMVSIEELEHAN